MARAASWIVVIGCLLRVIVDIIDARSRGFGGWRSGAPARLRHLGT